MILTMVSAERQAYLREYYQKHKAKMNAQAKAWGEAHRARICEIKRKWKVGNPDYDREYYLAHKEKYVHTPEENRKWREAHLEYFVKYRQEHKKEKNEEWHRWRARKYDNGPFEWISRQAVWERDKGICGICHQPAEESNWHLDHIVPLSKGGLHLYANVQVSHPLCNESKGANEDGLRPECR
jgi:hypothetical protein